MRITYHVRDILGAFNGLYHITQINTKPHKTRVVHGSILCDPILPNPSAD